MCRALAYLGRPLLLENLLYKTDSSLLQQTTNPQMLAMLNLAGMGVMAWEPESFDPGTPFTYKSAGIPMFDANLKALSQKVRPTAILAHVRGVPLDGLSDVGEHNLHPFRYPGFKLALAHNGHLARFAEMKFDLLDFMRPEISRQIRGTTDSEWIYALLMSQVDDPTADLTAADITRAIEGSLRILRQVRERRGIAISSAVNLFLCDGNDLIAARFIFDFGRFAPGAQPFGVSFTSLWYTVGSEFALHDNEWKMLGGAGCADSVMVASEPLTRDVSTWLEVPEYSLLYVAREGERPVVRIVDLDA